MTAGRKKTPQAIRDAWSACCRRIEKNAFEQGYRKGAVPQILKIEGDAPDRVWRSWKNPQKGKVPSESVRQYVLDAAKTNGWARFSEKELAGLELLTGQLSGIEVNFGLPHAPWLGDLAGRRPKRLALLLVGEAFENGGNVSERTLESIRNFDILLPPESVPDSGFTLPELVHQTLLRKEACEARIKDNIFSDLENSWRQATTDTYALIVNIQKRLAGKESDENVGVSVRAVQIAKAMITAAYIRINPPEQA